MITAGNGWSWNYKNERLGIYLSTDEGRSQFFFTHYGTADLYDPPKSSAAFCCEDARLLAAYEEGLTRIGLDESGSLDLGLNGVACERFVRPAIPMTRHFMSYDRSFNAETGTVVTVYTVKGKAGDCLVLEDQDIDGLCRLMLLNPELMLPTGRAVKLGGMIRVNPHMICPFRVYSGSGMDGDTARYA